MADTVTRSLAVVVAAAQTGDRAAFAELYAQYGRMVYGVMLARLPFAEAEDAVQEVFLAAWRQVKSLRDPEAFGGWICVIARNHAAQFHRRARTFTELDDQHPDPSTPPDTAAEARRALQAIRALPESYRETLILRLVEGMTGPEIADRTGMSHGSVRVNLHRGMEMLRAALKETTHE